jgi:hypothetical protein
MRSHPITWFALAVSIAVPFTPARAAVPAAPAGTRSAEINQPVIKVESWDAQKMRRQRRVGQGQCIIYNNRTQCEAQAICKWQKGTILHPGGGYCYPSAPNVAKPALGHKAQ